MEAGTITRGIRASSATLRQSDNFQRQNNMPVDRLPDVVLQEAALLPREEKRDIVLAGFGGAVTDGANEDQEGQKLHQRSQLLDIMADVMADVANPGACRFSRLSFFAGGSRVGTFSNSL